MNYVIYYYNSAGFPRFAWACGKSIDEAKEEFLRFHPNMEIIEIYISVRDIKNYLISNL